MSKLKVLLAAFVVLLCAASFFVLHNRGQGKTRPGFVATRGPRFVIDGKPFRFVGANVAIMYKDEDRERMPETLRVASQNGIRVLRVWAFGEGGVDSGVKSVGGDKSDWPRKHPFRYAPGKWNEEAFVHLDHVLDEAAKNNLRVQLCLTNWWRDTGGVTQYLKWAGIDDAADDSKPFGINKERAMLFYTNDDTRRMYKEHVDRIVSRRNTVTGLLYKDDPTIMGYELMNEAQAPTGRWDERRRWVAEMSAYIKSLDPHHLVAPGTWGYRTSWERREWLEEHRLATIDYCDVHNYPRDDHDSFVETPDMLRDFIANRAAAAYSINKPVVFGEFGIGPDGFNGSSEVEWYRAYFEATARDGVAGAMFWILTPDPNRGYGVSYTTKRDTDLLSEIRGASHLFNSLQGAEPPSQILDPERHLVPRQFGFALPENDPATIPETKTLPDGALHYLFKPQMAASARFEKLGGGEGYIWGAGSGFIEYVVPARNDWRKVGSILVRAHLKPVLPDDAHSPVTATKVTLLINGKDCGSRLIPEEDPKHAVNQEWLVKSYAVRLQAARGLPLHIMFKVDPNFDMPYGLNISNYPEGYAKEEVRPVQVEVR
jgi:mannan endo-1,4-beta-mannosidase